MTTTTILLLLLAICVFVIIYLFIANQKNVNEKTRLLAEKVALENQQKEITEIKTKMTNEFKVIASEILEDKSTRFTDSNKENIEAILKPLNESIKGFREKVEQNLTEETKQRTSLETQVKNLVENTNLVSEQANNLATALKGKSKIRGNWGEMVLDTVLQKAGMLEGFGYEAQKTIRDEDSNSIFYPDIIINLPDSRKLIIDSKVSLVSYEMYSSSEDEKVQEDALQLHIESIKHHINSLSSKDYKRNVDNSAGFMMMFIPIEPAYMAAIQKDGELWQYAYDKSIMLVSPSNLLPCLRLIKDLWLREKQSKNALEIVKRADHLLNKLKGFLDTFNSLGNSITAIHSNFSKAKDQLSDGSGSVFRQIEMLQKLGIKSQIKLPTTDFVEIEASEEDIDIINPTPQYL